jgi:hypothetical protein
MENKRTKSTKEKLIEATKKDPHIIGLITNLKYLGIAELTNFGTLILKYYNRKTNTTVIIDPTKPTLFIHDGTENFNIHIRLAIQTIDETYGVPEIEEIPKFFTNIPLNLKDTKNSP